ncbi:response regulator transcription factor [Gloeocapsopsis dulcis]|uniref:DNA-binding response regulator n=1 Tax=Gloeocapsopsis dulcis AAB1 = 1H9 TaxID=1433147 RepID=A0A6N8FTS4_9CHRO|nr:response regulator transcription factor [Gloeocapsopsis dulcis]MUL36259.1 DNA-binding response regulator [Gloeocapsopsis dulcis AAB1 = 1H9]WNN89631.1 response regulator transcription factor [Gloeocapsopsis dulcis]
MGSVCIEIIEGNPHLRSLLSWHLQQVGYRVHQAASLYQAQEVFLVRQPTLVILDAELKDSESMEFCHWLQRQQQPLILMLSTRNSEADVVAGLKAGADDYLAKPFGMQEFLARVEALIRRKRTPVAPAYLDYGALQIDLVQRRVCFQGEFIDLTPQEFSLLYVLAQAGGIPLSRLELLRRAWPEAIDNPRTIDTHVLSLRKKVERDPRQPNLIQTVRNVGYRFNMELLNNNVSQVPEVVHRRQIAAEHANTQPSALSRQF